MVEPAPGRVAVVTGASEGIGRAVATRLAADGCRVALLARRSELLEQLATEIAGQGGEARAFPCDLSDSSAVPATFAQIVQTLGPVDILINNAGTGTFSPFTATSPEAVRAPFDVPVLCALTASREVAQSMTERGTGSIVTILSPAAYFPLPFMVPYTASRWALLGFSRALREELGPRGVHVGTICPGAVETAYTDNNAADMDWFPRIARVFPTSQPEDVAAQVSRSVRTGRREIIFPGVLRLFATCYRLFPDTVLWLLKTTRLFQPRKRQEVDY